MTLIWEVPLHGSAAVGTRPFAAPLDPGRSLPGSGAGSCQTRPLSPIQPALPALRSPALAASAPEPSPPLLPGEGSARYAPQLEALMDQLHTALSSVRQLARRGGRPGRPPAGLPRHRPAAAAPAAWPPPIFSSPVGATPPRVRALAPPDRCPPPCAPCFDRPSNAAQAAGLARTVSDDPCLSRLLEDIQDEAQSHAAQIRVLLEGLL